MSKNSAVIIGAGPAGLMAAITAARRGISVRLFDRNGFPGKKLNITGKGRCNLTNDCDIQTFMANIPRNPRFLYSALNAFPPASLMSFIQALGVPLTVERGRRVFPASGRARDITDALEREAKRLGVSVEKRRVTELVMADGGVSAVLCADGRMPAGAVIVATGGLSYPLTGSDGDGYVFARSAGHSVTPLSASLAPLLSPDGFCGEMQGLSLKNVTMGLTDASGRTVCSEGPGEMLFTHFGISGPMTLSLSAHWKPGMNAVLDLKPGLSEEKLDGRLIRDFSERGAQKLSNVMRGLVPAALVPVLLSRAEADGEGRAGETDKAARRSIAAALKSFRVRISDIAPVEEAVVTRGGVSVREIDPRTMGSKLVKGLYFAGEVLDADGYTGGFNLQIAFSTGYAAGMGVLL